MKKPSIAIALTLFSAQTFAMFCPSGFNAVNIGDTIDQVIASCGKPDLKKSSKETPPHAQEWNYYVKPDPTQPTTLKMTFAFDSSGKVMNITVNGQTLTSSTICGGTVNIGDSLDSVKSSCGSPAFTNQGTEESQKEASSKAVEITEFTYNTTPKTVYIFEGGKLKERKH